MPSPAVQPLLALLASHVGGNPTQYMFEQAFAHHKLDWRYMTFEVEPDDLGDALRGLRVLGFRGGHCADPHKQPALHLLDDTTETAQSIGSVNLIFRKDDVLTGHNTEGFGALQAIRRILDPAGKRVVLLGAGQTARAIAVELAAVGPADLTVVNRTESRAADLIALLAEKRNFSATASPWQEPYAVPVDADILIHATSCNRDDPEASLPISLDSLRPELTVVDVTFSPSRTWLLAQAENRGCRVIDGLGVFIEQVAVDFQLWTGVDPDRQILHDAAEEFLGL